MDSDSVVSAILGVSATVLVIGIVVWVLLIVAEWKIFSKAGEAGWKSLIPIYNIYISYKISWNTTMFWVTIALSVVYGILIGQDSDACTTIANIVLLANSVIGIMQVYKLAKSFGHGVGYTIGMLLLPNIFTLMLGFGKSEYIGPEGIGTIKSENI